MQIRNIESKPKCEGGTDVGICGSQSGMAKAEFAVGFATVCRLGFWKPQGIEFVLDRREGCRLYTPSWLPYGTLSYHTYKASSYIIGPKGHSIWSGGHQMSGSSRGVQVLRDDWLQVRASQRSDASARVIDIRSHVIWFLYNAAECLASLGQVGDQPDVGHSSQGCSDERCRCAHLYSLKPVSSRFKCA